MNCNRDVDTRDCGCLYVFTENNKGSCNSHITLSLLTGVLTRIFTNASYIPHTHTHLFCVSAEKNTHYLLVFDSFVIIVCLTSSVLCTRSIILAIRLLQVSSPPCTRSYLLSLLSLYYLTAFLVLFMVFFFLMSGIFCF